MPPPQLPVGANSYYETPSVNQYEVPFSHLIQHRQSLTNANDVSISSKSSNASRPSAGSHPAQQQQTLLQHQSWGLHVPAAAAATSAMLPQFGSQQFLPVSARLSSSSRAAATATAATVATSAAAVGQPTVAFSSASAGHIFDLVGGKKEEEGFKNYPYFHYLGGYDI